MDNGSPGAARPPALEIILNGAPFTVECGTNIDGLIRALGLTRARLAIERNLEIVPRSAYGMVLLEPGDRVEIVNFVGGG